jgi:hypothetical protein
MKCTICGKPSLPGMALCAPCKAALKRARYVTVQEDLRPSVQALRRKPRRRAGAVSERKATEVTQRHKGPEPTPPPAASGTRLTGRHLLIGGMAVAVLAAAAYVALHGSPAGTAARALATGSSASSRDPDAAGMVAVSPERPATPESAGEVASSTKIPPDSSGGADDPLPAKTPAAKPAAAAKRSTALSAPSSAVPAAEPLEMVAVPQESPKPAPAPMPVRPQVDRWQTMSDALGKCDREGVFNGLICGQRVRIQYCDGYWGQVPQCPGTVSNLDHGP